MGRESVHDARLDEAARIERSDSARALLLADEVIAETRLADDERTMHLQARALLQRARTLSFLRELEEALDTAARAHAAAREAGDPDTMVLSRILLGHIFTVLGHEEAAIVELRETILMAADLGASPAVCAACHMTLGSTLRRLELFEDAFAAYRHAELQARPTGNDILVANILVNVASAGWQSDQVEQARAALAESRALYQAHGRLDLLVWQDAMEAWVEGQAGRLEIAITRAEAAIENDASMEVEARTSATRALARALSRAGQPADLERARGLLEHLIEDAKTGPRTIDVPMVTQELSEVCARSGDLEGALRWSRTAYDALRLQQNERRRRRHTAEAFRLRVVRAEIEAEQLRLRTRALESANRELAFLSDERAKLMAMVAHDMRAPLTAILLSLHFLRETGADSEDLLSPVADAVERMTVVLDRTLSTDAIRTGRAPIRRGRVDVGVLVRRCVAGLKSLADRKRITLSLSCDAEIVTETDEPALARIVENLVSNALKFSEVDRQVEVVVGTEGDHVHIHVRDEGPGFAAGEVETLFQFGTRGTAAPTAGEDSTGVGLHVVHDLVRALGGRVRLANRPDRPGALAEVTLPLA